MYTWDSQDYLSYLSDKIAEEEDRLKDMCRVVEKEQQLATLQIKTYTLSIYIRVDVAYNLRSLFCTSLQALFIPPWFKIIGICDIFSL